MQIVRQIMPRGMPIIVDAVIEDDEATPTTVSIYPVRPDGIIGEALPFKGELGGIVAKMIHKKNPKLEETPHDTDSYR